MRQKNFYHGGLINFMPVWPTGDLEAYEWSRTAAKAHEFYMRGRYGKRRRNPKWIAWRREWKRLRDVARRRAQGEFPERNVLLRKTITTMAAGAALVLVLPMAAVTAVTAVPAVVLVGVANWLDNKLK